MRAAAPERQITETQTHPASLTRARSRDTLALQILGRQANQQTLRLREGLEYASFHARDSHTRFLGHDKNKHAGPRANTGIYLSKQHRTEPVASYYYLPRQKRKIAVGRCCACMEDREIEQINREHTCCCSMQCTDDRSVQIPEHMENCEASRSCF